ncbi:MAG: magnesium transporter [Gammaproteobacteria bacterium]
MSDEITENEKTVLQSITELVRDGLVEQIDAIIQGMHPADIAHLLESLPSSDRQIVWQHVADDLHGETLIHLNEEARAQLMRGMDAGQLVAATETLDTDDLADILPEMPQHVIQELLLTMEHQDRERLRSVLSYPEDSAGGLMDLETVMVRADVTLDVVLRYLRRRGKIPTATDTLFVVDRDSHFLGLLPLTRLLTEEPSQLVSHIMQTDVAAIPAETRATEVANLFERRDWITAPVVDADNRLLGRITIDDVVDVIRDEADHSLLSMAGLNEEDDMFAPVMRSTRRRSVWLGINLLTAFLASWVIGFFDKSIEHLVALAVLMPIVASMGGIAGSQTLTLVIRGMALGQISESNAHRLFIKEVGIGIWNGLIWAVVIALIAGSWFMHVGIGLIIGSAIVINLVVAAAAGAIIPLLLRRMGADPALSGPVVLTTVTDVVGFLSFLGLATIFLM